MMATNKLIPIEKPAVAQELISSGMFGNKPEIEATIAPAANPIPQVAMVF